MKEIKFKPKEIALIIEAFRFYGIDTKESRDIVKRLEKSQKRITISSAKGKGRSLQQWTARLISKLIHIPYDNQDDRCLIHSREMGQAGVDVILRGEAWEKFPFAIECKSTENFNFTGTIKQAQENTPKGSHWMIVYKKKALNRPVFIISKDGLEFLYYNKVNK